MSSNTQETEVHTTQRAVSFELEKILNHKHKVLDHGFIRVIDYMGNDNAIVQSARVSYGKGTKTLQDDTALIRYLIRHKHTTPLEMCEIKFHIKMPIFIARQWVRHRTANVNEYSGRYSILDKEYYIPKKEQLATQSMNNKQGKNKLLDKQEAKQVLNILKSDGEALFKHYETMLNVNEADNKKGLTRELARINLPLNTYTQLYWKIDLHNLLHFLALRADEHAQYEIRAYALIMLEIIKKWVPVVYQAFLDYRFNAISLSNQAKLVVQKLINQQTVSQAESGLSKREWVELMEQLEINN